MSTVVSVIQPTPEMAPGPVIIPEGVTIEEPSPHENFKKKHEKGKLNWKKDVPLRYRALAWAANKTYNVLDTFYNFDEKKAKENAHFQKYIREIVDTGPDEDERLIFATRDAFGVYRKYDGSPVSAERVKRARKRARFNVARYQALAAYEITKLEEHEQEEGWQRIIDVMHRDLGFTHHEIFEVMIGLQFMNKASYLIYKHRRLEHPPMRDAEGKIMREFVPEYDDKGNLKYDEEGHAKGRYVIVEDHDRLCLGSLDVRSYVTELAEKFKTYQYSFNPADVAALHGAIVECKKLCDHAVTMKPGETVQDVQKRVNSKEFRDALYALKEMRLAIEASKMGSSTDSEGEMSDLAARQNEMQRAQMEVIARSQMATDQNGDVVDPNILAELRLAGLKIDQINLTPNMSAWDMTLAIEDAKQTIENQNRTTRQNNIKQTPAGKPKSPVRGIQYPPRIGGSAAANSLWQQVADVIDSAYETYGKWMQKARPEHYGENTPNTRWAGHTTPDGWTTEELADFDKRAAKSKLTAHPHHRGEDGDTDDEDDTTRPEGQPEQPA